MQHDELDVGVVVGTPLGAHAAQRRGPFIGGGTELHPIRKASDHLAPQLDMGFGRGTATVATTTATTRSASPYLPFFSDLPRSLLLKQPISPRTHGLNDHRYPVFDARVRKVERRGHDADDGAGAVVELELLADQIGIAAEIAPPGAARQQDDVVVARRFFVVGERPSLGGVDAEQAEECGRDRRPGETNGLVSSSHGGGLIRVHRHVGESVAIFSPGEEQPLRRHAAGTLHLHLRIGLGDLNDAVGIVIGKRLQEDAVDDAEDRRVGADTEAEGQDDDRRESGGLGEATNGETQILQQGAHDYLRNG